MNIAIPRIFLVGAACLGLTVLPARAQLAASPAPEQPAAAAPVAASNPFSIRLGAFLLSSIRTTLSLSDSNGQVGSDIDFAKTLGGKESLNVFRADGEWAFNDKHKVQLSYFDINLTATRTLSASIDWGDQTYPVSATVNSQFRTSVYKLNYGYTFYRNPTHEVSGLIGLHITRFRTSIGLASAGSAEGVSATAPLPLFGLEWKARLTDQLTSHVSFAYFGISLDDKYSGNLSDFQAILDYRFSRNWSAGAGYNRYVLRASVKSERQRELALRHNYNGLMIFVATSF